MIQNLQKTWEQAIGDFTYFWNRVLSYRYAWLQEIQTHENQIYTYDKLF